MKSSKTINFTLNRDWDFLQLASSTKIQAQVSREGRQDRPFVAHTCLAENEDLQLETQAQLCFTRLCVGLISCINNCVCTHAHTP